MQAEDDEDDRLIFEGVLFEVRMKTKLPTAANGQELMQTSHDTVPPQPELIFLDLSMPGKNEI